MQRMLMLGGCVALFDTITNKPPPRRHEAVVVETYRVNREDGAAKPILSDVMVEYVSC